MAGHSGRVIIVGLAWSSLAVLVLALAPAPATAQFRLPDLTRGAVTDAQGSDTGCAEGRSKSIGGKVLGGLLGRAVRGAADRTGVSRWVPVAGFSDQLTESIACRLDPEEQAQAAEATLEATRGGEGDDGGEGLPAIGASASWTSRTRPDVSGQSTVIGRESGVGDTDCITVTDIVIIKGEETRADKRMCRPPGSRRYSIVA